MTKGRLEAFSDGVIAIIITIMVLELKAPRGDDWNSLKPLLPVFLSYLISFIYVGIYWNNHHHMLHLVKEVNGAVLWANLHLLFWLSLIPFITGWADESHFSSIPVAAYAFILLMAGAAYTILEKCLMAIPGHNQELKQAMGKDWKGMVSVIFYAIAIGAAFVQPFISIGLIIAVACMWFIPDRRIEKHLKESK